SSEISSDRVKFDEFIQHEFGTGGATAFDQNQIARPHDLIQNLSCVARVLRDGGIFQACLLRRQRNRVVTNRDEVINSQRRRGFADFTMTALRFRAKRSEEHTSALQSHLNLVCCLLLEKNKEQNSHVK